MTLLRVLNNCASSTEPHSAMVTLLLPLAPTEAAKSFDSAAVVGNIDEEDDEAAAFEALSSVPTEIDALTTSDHFNRHCFSVRVLTKDATVFHFPALTTHAASSVGLPSATGRPTSWTAMMSLFSSSADHLGSVDHLHRLRPPSLN